MAVKRVKKGKRSVYKVTHKGKTVKIYPTKKQALKRQAAIAMYCKRES